MRRRWEANETQKRGNAETPKHDMRTTVKIRVPVPAEADAGDRVQVFTDFGTGTIDTSRPLLKHPKAVFRGARKRFGGHGTESYGESAYGLGRQGPDPGPGHGSEIYGVTPYGVPVETIEVTVSVPPAYGLHKFSARMLDAMGNLQGAALPEVTVFVSSVQPPGLRSFAFASFDSGARTATFTFARDSE